MKAAIPGGRESGRRNRKRRWPSWRGLRGGASLRHIEQRQQHASISESTAVRYLRGMKFTFKRYRYSLKKRNREAFDRADQVIGRLGQLDLEHGCELLYLTNQVLAQTSRCSTSGPQSTELKRAGHFARPTFN
jgi:hypothetical protein